MPGGLFYCPGLARRTQQALGQGTGATVGTLNGALFV
jgi:hypothetical protein